MTCPKCPQPPLHECLCGKTFDAKYQLQIHTMCIGHRPLNTDWRLPE